MVKNSKDERLKLVRLGPVPKTVDMEEIGGEVDKTEDAVPTINIGRGWGSITLDGLL
jgi:hypothetical protein